MPPKKLDKLKALWAAGKRDQALRMAASWPRLGEHEDTIRRGSSALLSPGMYRGMGKDPEALVAAAYAALAVRYELPVVAP